MNTSVTHTQIYQLLMSFQAWCISLCKQAHNSLLPIYLKVDFSHHDTSLLKTSTCTCQEHGHPKTNTVPSSHPRASPLLMEHHMVCTPHQILNFPISPRCFIQLYIFFPFNWGFIQGSHSIDWLLYFLRCPLEQYPSLPLLFSCLLCFSWLQIL